MLSLKSSDEIAYNGSSNTARMDLFADTASDLTGVTTFDSIVLLAGSSALDISTGDLYRMQSDGTWILQPGTGAFTNVYTKAEIDAMLANYYTKAEADELFEWITFTITTDTLPLVFIADGSPLTAWSMLGNGQQTGTPTPDNPITPDFVGTLDNSDWTIPITCAEQTSTVNLGEVPTVRRVRKLVLTGEEQGWVAGQAGGGAIRFRLPLSDITIQADTQRPTSKCTHFPLGVEGGTWNNDNVYTISYANDTWNLLLRVANISTLDNLQQYLRDEYASGHPVTIWYVLATPTAGIVNEPLCKIGDYADELHSSDAGVTIPISKGTNTLSVDTTLQPSEMSITGNIRET